MQILIIPVAFAFIKGIKMHDMKQQLDIVWDALQAYREDLIQEGDEQHDAIWDEVCTAMSVIEENLKVME